MVSSTCKLFSRLAQRSVDRGHLYRQEGAAGETGKGRRGRIVEQQALEFLPGSAGCDGGEIILRQLHSTISSYLFHMRYVIHV